MTMLKPILATVAAMVLAAGGVGLTGKSLEQDKCQSQCKSVKSCKTGCGHAADESKVTTTASLSQTKLASLKDESQCQGKCAGCELCLSGECHKGEGYSKGHEGNTVKLAAD